MKISEVDITRFTHGHSLLLSILILLSLLSGCERIDDWEVQRPVVVHPCASLPSARSGASAFVLGGKAFVLGGRSNSNAREVEYCSDTWCYDAVSDTWHEISSPPCVGRVQAVAVAVNNVAYYGMGFAGNGPYALATYLNDFWSFDGSEWRRLEDFPGSGSDALVAFPTDTAIFVALGYNPLFQPEVYCYHIASGMWSRCANITHLEPAAGCVGGYVGGRYFAGGGFMEITQQRWAEYLPASDTWQLRQSMPYPGRLFAPTAQKDDEIYVFGGMIWGSKTVGGGATNTIYSYSPAGDSWQLRGRLPKATYNGVAFTINGVMYYGLGQDDRGEVHGELYSIKP